MTGPQILIFATFLVFLIAATIGIVWAYRQSSEEMEKHKEFQERLLRENQQQKEMIEALKNDFEQFMSGDEMARLKAQAEDTRVQLEATSQMDDGQLNAWIEEKVQQDLLFCDPELDLKTLSQRLGITQKRLRLFIKQSKYEKLYDFLTEKRILHACKLLKENPNWTIEAVSKDVGFVSRTTFQEAFKKYIGITPARYRAQSK